MDLKEEEEGDDQGTRKPTTARKKSVLSVVFTSDVYVLKKNYSGSGLRAPAKPVAGTRFSPRDGAPSPPPALPAPPRPGGQVGSGRPQDRLKRTALQQLAPFVLYMYCCEAL